LGVQVFKIQGVLFQAYDRCRVSFKGRRMGEMIQTSLLAYQELKAEGVVDSNQQKVLDTLKHYCKNYAGLTDRELQVCLGWKDSNMVRPRRRELVKQGLVEDAGQRECSVSRRLAKIWRAV
jgi:hypothetical protein